MAAFAVVVAVSREPHDPKAWPVPDAARKLKNPVPQSSTALAAAKPIFDLHCANCHADTGKGDGPDAEMYSVKPADLTDTHMMSQLTDGEIFYKISEGHNPMPAFKKLLTEEQRWQLVHFVRSFASPSAPSKKSDAKRAPGQ